MAFAQVCRRAKRKRPPHRAALIVSGASGGLFRGRQLRRLLGFRRLLGSVGGLGGRRLGDGIALTFLEDEGVALAGHLTQ